MYVTTAALVVPAVQLFDLLQTTYAYFLTSVEIQKAFLQLRTLNFVSNLFGNKCLRSKYGQEGQD